ncbi:MAG: hypothetical protein M3356_03370 [Actinomycetota bacterium]|nr:hypothetical protein [Actinomycetota bacterium]
MTSRSTFVRGAVGAAVHADLAVALGPRFALEHRRQVRERARGWESSAARLYGDIWRSAAAEVDAEIVERSPGEFCLSRDGRSTRVLRQVTALDDEATLERSRDRARLQRAFAGVGVPVAEHLDFPASDPRPAVAFLETGRGPCVVKPGGATGAGYGVTCGVRNRRDLVRACLQAARFADTVLIERQAPGAMYRVLVLDGEPIAVVRRNPPQLTGDGSSSIQELVAAENRRRLAAGGRLGLSLLRADLDCLIALRTAGLSMRSIPPADVRVTVKTSSSDTGPAGNHTVHEVLGAELTNEVLAAAQVTGLALAGVDVVTADLRSGLATVGGALLEVNAIPGLHHHYMVFDPASVQRVAVPILQRLLR